MINGGITDPREFAKAAKDVINAIDNYTFNIETSELRLVLLFDDNNPNS